MQVERCTFRSLCAILLIALMTTGAFATVVSEEVATYQEPLPDAANPRFDMGTDRSPLMQGWVRVESRDLYNAGDGYGWNESASGGAYATPDQLDWFMSQPNDMIVDCILVNRSLSFRIDVANGDWRVFVTLGDLRTLVNRGGAHSNQGFSVNDVVIATNATTRQFDHRNIFLPLNTTTQHGGFQTFRTTTTVTRGMVLVNFTGTPTERTYVAGIEAHPVGALPIEGSVTSLTLDPSITDPGIQSGVSSYNAGDLDLALEAFLGVANGTSDQVDLAKALGLLWTVGRPDNLNNTGWVLPIANGIIQGYCRNNPTDWAAYEMCQVSHYINATVHLYHQRGYGGGDTLLKNIYHSEMLALNMQPGDPVYEMAQFYRMRAFHGCDPRRTTYQTVFGDEIAMELYPNYTNVVEVVYHHMFATFGEDNNNDMDAAYPQYAGLRHWETDYTFGGENAPEWAKKQREASKRLIEFMEWWRYNRQIENGELGGGWSDDVELTRSWRGTLIGLQGVSPDAVDAATLMADGVWESGAIKNGFQALISDVEHSGEMTADGEAWMPGIAYGDPLYIERNMETHLQIHNNFTGVNDEGNRHFKSYWFGSNGISPNPTYEYDVPLNARAVENTFWNRWYNNGQMEDEFAHDWTEAWLDECLKEDDGKPKGYVPPGVHWSDAELNDGVRPWWNFNGNNPYTWPATTNHGRIVYEMLIEEWVRTGDDKYLEPVLLVAQKAKRYTGPPDPPVGSQDWINKSAQDSGIFESLQRWRWLTGNDTFDAELQGLWGRETPYTKYLITNDKTVLYDNLDKTIRWTTYYFPFMTSENIMTDRAYVRHGTNALQTTMLSGGQGLLGPGVSVTWGNTTRDFAALVTNPGTKDIDVLAYNFNPEPREIDMRLWTLPNGRYNLTLGPDSNEDDTADIVTHADVKNLTHRGDGFTFTLLPQQLVAIHVRQVEKFLDQSTSLADLAAAERDLVVDLDNDQIDIDLKVHNIGNTDADSFNVTFHQEDASGNSYYLGTVPVAGLAAPSDCKNKVVNIALLDVDAFGLGNFTVRAYVDNEDVVPEITEVNNIVEVLVQRDLDAVPELVAPANDSWANATPTLEVRNPTVSKLGVRIQVVEEDGDLATPLIDVVSYPDAINWTDAVIPPSGTGGYIVPYDAGLMHGQSYIWRAAFLGGQWSEVWTFTMDSLGPNVTVLAPEFNKGTTLDIKWNITEDGSGLSGNITVFQRLDSEENFTKMPDVTGDSVPFEGEDGKRYVFQVEADDVAGNLGVGNATTLMDARAPVSQVYIFEDYHLSDHIPVSWNGTDHENGSGIAGYNIWVSTDNGTTWDIWLDMTEEVSAVYNGTQNHSYRFASQAVDRAGNVEVTDWNLSWNVTVDNTIPDGRVRGKIHNLSTMSVELDFWDPESGIKKIEYKIGYSFDGDEVVPLTVANETSFTLTGLELMYGMGYTIYGKATNGANMESPWIGSNQMRAPPEVSGLRLIYHDGVLTSEFIRIKASADLSPIYNWDIEINSSPYVKGVYTNWSGWQEIGDDAGDGDLDHYNGTRGMAYRFRARATFAGSNYSEYLEPEAIARINALPVVDITYNGKAETGNRITFVAEAFDNDGDTLNFTWDFGDGKTDNTNQLTTTHSYKKAKTYTVKLMVYDGHETLNATLVLKVEEGPGTGVQDSLVFGIMLVIVIAIIIVTLLIAHKKGWLGKGPRPPEEGEEDTSFEDLEERPEEAQGVDKGPPG
jgi:hypothetical protein